ncbi:hypothetical protein DPMN_189849 [Dreissena polymorpha]|uniref:Ig-like domain-containing protein n=1 Tax=Dreissena polymorpha TaxID=45954 RepID=A0A9D4DSP7_DREPO|nr:hypothetical protein DPMN_189849 [Dreissena polymorpha]
MAINIYIPIITSFVFAKTDAVTVGFYGVYYGNTTVHCDDKALSMPYITYRKYWIIPNGSMLGWDHKPDDKYTVGVWPTFNLTIANLGDYDFGYYYCVVQWDNPRYVVHSIRIKLMPNYETLVWGYGKRAIIGGLVSGVVTVIVTVTCLAYWCKFSEHNTINEDKTTLLKDEDEQSEEKHTSASKSIKSNTEIGSVSNHAVINQSPTKVVDDAIIVEKICNTISDERVIEPIYSMETVSQDSEESTNSNYPDNSSNKYPYAKVMNHKSEFLKNDNSEIEDSVGRQAVYDLEKAAIASISMGGTTNACDRELANELGNFQKRLSFIEKSKDAHVRTYTVPYRGSMDREENEPPLPPPPPPFSEDDETKHANINRVILPFNASVDEVIMEPIERTNADSDDHIEFTFADKIALFEKESRNKVLNASEHDGIANVIEYINDAFNLDDEHYSVHASGFGEEIEVEDSDNFIYMDDDNTEHYADLRF